MRIIPVAKLIFCFLSAALLSACESSKSSGGGSSVQTSLNQKGNFVSAGTLSEAEQDNLNLCKAAGNNLQKLTATSGTSLMSTINFTSIAVGQKYTAEDAGANDGYKVQYAISEVTSGTNIKYTGTYLYAPSSLSSIIGKILNFELNVTVATSSYGYSISRTMSSDLDKVLTANELSASLQLSLYSSNCENYNFNYTSPTTETIEGGTFVLASGQMLPAIKVTYSYPGQLTCGTGVASPETAVKDQTLIIANKYLDPTEAPYCNGGSVLYDFESIKSNSSDKLIQKKSEVTDLSL